ncbi:MAG: serine hydrolase [Candidatus Saccharibacteria bacterium]|nr:serine hydrolase [Candidatus Saccharibacteria bacterium]
MFYTNSDKNYISEGQNQTSNVSEPAELNKDKEVANEEKTKPKFDAEALQQTINTWASNLGSDDIASVVVMDNQGDILAEVNPDQEYFTASLYKLFVAYEGYKQFDSGEVDTSEVFLNGQTRAECIDKMIRSSDSPCAEKLWLELGKEELTAIMKTYGIKNTTLVGLSTTATDTAIMLARIAWGEGLSETSRTAYLSSMKEQDGLYRRGLPSGFSANVTVYNKVGWNEQVEWHDASIIEFEDGRQLIVAVLTENVGTAQISKLGTMIEQSVSSN